ncbi:MAG TPA: nicotinate-nucleotide adenylyltransferase [Planctomycetota bacterium]|jgi:nicotinate-nucleotide adenylyltransferase|nr:nicotinate-nucleotide adenylyltransferase [Planctomycetota bacterium]
MRVGVYGGSFDPIHNGHVAVASAARDRGGLAQVLLVPAAAPPHKEGRVLAPAEHRLAMVVLAVEGRPGLEASDLEIRRGGRSYTVDTLEEVRALSPPGAEVLLVIGSDTLPDLPQWKDIHGILARTRVLTIVRRGFARSAVEGLRGSFTAEEVGALAAGFLEIEPVDVSATEVRERLRRGLRVDDLLPPAVAAYIARHGLYRSDP